MRQQLLQRQVRRCIYRIVLATVSCSVVFAALSTQAAEGPFIGLDLGVSEATNDNYRKHVETGATIAPFAGYMFNDYFGLQGGLHVNAQPPDDNDGRPQLNFDYRNQWTTMLGATVGPRLQLPLGDLFDVYVTAQGGGFKGLGGRLNQWAPGFQVGGGVDYNLTPQLSVNVFGRWNRAYMAPHPANLAGQARGDQGPQDARWATAGVGLKYAFNAPEPGPPPAAAPVAVPQIAPVSQSPPAKKKIILRSVHFDFDKATIRADAVPVLNEAADTIKAEDLVMVVVEGHTDSAGTDGYNQRLSRRRAESATRYMVNRGISQSHFTFEGFGESRPVAPNDTADGRAQNRRVELRVE